MSLRARRTTYASYWAALLAGPLTADAPNARVVLGAKVALGRLAATPPDLSIEGRATALAHRGAALGPDTAVELFPILLARGGATTARRFRAGPGTRLAARSSYLATRCSIGLDGGRGLTVRPARTTLAHARLLLIGMPSHREKATNAVEHCVDIQCGSTSESLPAY